MVIWAEALDRIVPLCQDVEERLIKLLWRARPSGPSVATSQQSPSLAHSHLSAYSTSAAGSLADHGSSDAAHPLAMKRGLYGEQGRGLEPDEKEQATTVVVEKAKGGATRRRWRRTWYGRKIPVREAVSTRDEDDDPEKEGDMELAAADERRPVLLYAPLYNGLAAGIALGMFFGHYDRVCC